MAILFIQKYNTVFIVEVYVYNIIMVGICIYLEVMFTFPFHGYFMKFLLSSSRKFDVIMIFFPNLRIVV